MIFLLYTYTRYILYFKTIRVHRISNRYPLSQNMMIVKKKKCIIYNVVNLTNFSEYKYLIYIYIYNVNALCIYSHTDVHKCSTIGGVFSRCRRCEGKGDRDRVYWYTHIIILGTLLPTTHQRAFFFKIIIAFNK